MRNYESIGSNKYIYKVIIIIKITIIIIIIIRQSGISAGRRWNGNNVSIRYSVLTNSIRLKEVTIG